MTKEYHQLICTRDKKGKFHSYNDIPAVKFQNIEEWYEHGLTHRFGKPAIIHLEGLFEPKYYYKGVLVDEGFFKGKKEINKEIKAKQEALF